MSGLREAAQRALEALERTDSEPRTEAWEREKEAIAAIRAALAQEQAEPVQEPVARMYTGVMSNGIEHGPHLIWKPASMDAMSASKGVKATPLYTAPPKADPVQEPVVWTLTKTLDKRETTTNGYLWFSNPQNSSWTPLYTAPPQRTMMPLTDEEIDALPWNGSPRQFARAVEKTSWEKK